MKCCWDGRDGTSNQHVRQGSIDNRVDVAPDCRSCSASTRSLSASIGQRNTAVNGHAGWLDVADPVCKPLEAHRLVREVDRRGHRTRATCLPVATESYSPKGRSCPHYLLTADAGDEGAMTVIEGRVLATTLIDPQPHLTTRFGRARLSRMRTPVWFIITANTRCFHNAIE